MKNSTNGLLPVAFIAVAAAMSPSNGHGAEIDTFGKIINPQRTPDEDKEIAEHTKGRPVTRLFFACTTKPYVIPSHESDGRDKDTILCESNSNFMIVAAPIPRSSIEKLPGGSYELTIGDPISLTAGVPCANPSIGNGGEQIDVLCGTESVLHFEMGNPDFVTEFFKEHMGVRVKFAPLQGPGSH